ncbi:hypothetical protein [Arabiibacter massiliensis]|uniref:hypothetical protein n=1 Tax=Arabiibacter massiliensis TaxID=1870985 RepID=UPI0009BBCBED|nr:hypothetical protein [Arabiibacter massiliensis]
MDAEESGCEFCGKRNVGLKKRAEAYEGTLLVVLYGNTLDAGAYLPDGKVVANALMDINYCPCCGRRLSTPS